MRLREKKKRSEERESRSEFSLLSCRNLSNVVAHRCHHQDRCVSIYNISLPYRCPTQELAQHASAWDSDFPYLVRGAPCLVSQNNHYFWNQRTPIFCSPPIQQPNDARLVSTRLKKYILLGVYKTLRL